MTHNKAPHLSPSSPSDEAVEPSWSSQLPNDGSFDVASAASWAAKRAMQLNPQIEPNFRETVRGLVGSTFSDDEIKTLERRALDQVHFDDLGTLHDINAGVPVELSPRQDKSIRGLFERMGNDPLVGRARGAHDQGIKSGKIRVR